MTEASSSPRELEKIPNNKGPEINSKFGLILVGNDAINLGVAEYVIASMLDRLKVRSPSIELVGAIILPSIPRDQVRKIYPDLEGKFLDAFIKVFGENESVLAIFQQTDPGETKYDFISEINKTKGEIKRHKPKGGEIGWGTSIRGAIPLPSDRVRFEEVDNKIDSGKLSPEDYVKLTHHLIHSADNAEELAGLYLLIDEKNKREIFGNKVESYDKWAQENAAR